MGAGYLEGYGHHPGTLVLLIYIVAAGLSGVQRGGWDGFIGGCAVGLICLGPFYLIGCYSRAKDYEEDMEKTFEILQKK
jgi:hypothetical protein